jgi:tetratricopeptide (TPR) repeat protein
LAGEDRERLTRRYTDDAAAYELYLRGRYFWNKRTPEDLRRAITYFQEAIEKDPHYALAHAGLADSYNVLAVLSEVPAEGAYARAKAAALEALRLDDGLAEAHTSLASVQLRHDWDWGGAEREFRRAIELNPSYPTAHYWYGLYLAEVGRPEEAVAEVRRAQEVDPLSLNTSYHVGVVLYYVRRYDEAIEQLRSTLELEPGFVQGHRYLALACEQKRLYAEATAELQRAVALGGRSALLQSLLGHVDAVAGRKDQARKVARALRAQPGTAPYHLAVLYAGLGEKEEALRWLEKAYAERSSWLTVLRADPRLDGLRADPRFEDLMRRVGLTPTSGPP